MWPLIYLYTTTYPGAGEAVPEAEAEADGLWNFVKYPRRKGFSSSAVVPPTPLCDFCLARAAASASWSTWLSGILA